MRRPVSLFRRLFAWARNRSHVKQRRLAPGLPPQSQGRGLEKTAWYRALSSRHSAPLATSLTEQRERRNWRLSASFAREGSRVCSVGNRPVRRSLIRLTLSRPPFFK